MRKKYPFKHNEAILRDVIEAPPPEKRWICRADKTAGVICTAKTGGKEGTLDLHQTCGWSFG